MCLLIHPGDVLKSGPKAWKILPIRLEPDGDLLGIVVQPLSRRLLTRSGDDGHAKAGAKTGGDLVMVRTQ